MTNWKHVFRNFCKFIRNPKLKYLIYIRFQTLNSVLCRSPRCSNYSFESSWVSLQVVHTVDLGSLSHSCWQILSCSIWLDGKHLWIAIFRSLCRCSVGFNSGLWLGYSRTVRDLSRSHANVVLWDLICGTLCTQVCAFLNYVQSIQFATGGLQSSSRYISRIIKANRIKSTKAKCLSTYVNERFQFLNFN